MADFVTLLKNNGDKDHSKWNEWSFGKQWISSNKSKERKPLAICIENPLVSVVSITKYKNLCDLPGVGADLNKNIDLWHMFLKYDLHILTDSDHYAHNKNGITLTEAQHFFKGIRNEVADEKENHDALICVLGGHGHNDALITSDHTWNDGKQYSLDTLQDYFSCKAEPLLSNKPRIFVVDLCRGADIPADVIAPKETFLRWRGVTGQDIHPDSDITVIYSNTKKYMVPENNNGSVMIGSLSDVMQNTDLCTHDLGNIATMVSQDVATQTPLLCVELVTRNKYLIYLKQRQTTGRLVINGHEVGEQIIVRKNKFDEIVRNVGEWLSQLGVIGKFGMKSTMVIFGAYIVIVLLRNIYSKFTGKSIVTPGFAEAFKKITVAVVSILVDTGKGLYDANFRKE